MKFSGSYLEDDVEFLLKVIDIDFTSIEEKERLIQSGKSHYSQMINKEYEPTQEYLDTFYEVFELNKIKFANDILTLAYNLSKKDDIVLVSLVRAGTPIGVLLKRVLKQRFNKDVKHYSISIIRDREIDNLALKYIEKKSPNSEMIFVDGWTGKGVINRELKIFIDKYNKENQTNISDKLYVVSDIAGVSDFAVNNDDYLIPSSALNSTISGLVSRSILNEEYIKEGDFHGCKYYKEYKNSDLSLWFIDEVTKIISDISIDKKPLVTKDIDLNQNVNRFIDKTMKEYNISDINHIKPGIGESTRVLLRRVPYIIIVKDISSNMIQHLIHLAKEKKVKVVEDRNLPYSALAIIKNVTKRIFFFSDLDDTVIQTKRKTDFNKPTIVGSYDKDGNESSFFYEGTKLLIDTMIDAGISFIPTTARNLDAYQRTVFYKNSDIKYAILNFGGLILIDNKIDENWSNMISKKYSEVLSMEILNEKLNIYLKKANLDLQVKIIDGYYISIYNKNNLDNQDILINIKKTLNQFIEKYNSFYIYENGNSFGILPNFLNKKYGVEYIINKYSPIVTIGAGDNISDLEFMKLSNFKLLPENYDI